MAGKPKSAARPEPKNTRASISFPTDRYLELERLAHEKKVSLAWVVREAVEKYIDEQWPLFGKPDKRE